MVEASNKKKKKKKGGRNTEKEDDLDKILELGGGHHGMRLLSTRRCLTIVLILQIVGMNPKEKQKCIGGILRMVMSSLAISAESPLM